MTTGKDGYLRRVLQTLAPAIGLAVIFALFAAAGPASFSSKANLQTIARQTAIVGTAALGMTMVMIAGGIDLSVGSIIALSTVIIASLLQQGPKIGFLEDHFTAWVLVSALGGVGIGVLCGLLNGFLITRLRVVPFIVTLGTLLVLRGAAKGFAHEQKIDAPMSWLNSLLATLPRDQAWLLFPVGVWMMILLAVLMACLLHFTRLGRHIFAVGSNELTARLCGIAVNRVKLAVYTLGAAFAGLAGVLQFSRLTVGDPTVAVGAELDIIAAVVIGGGSLSGGEGSVLGSIIGALIMTTIRSGCSQMGLENWIQEIVTGAIIVVAVALDRLRHRRAAQ